MTQPTLTTATQTIIHNALEKEYRIGYHRGMLVGWAIGVVSVVAGMIVERML
jgi:hypothetical protein